MVFNYTAVRLRKNNFPIMVNEMSNWETEMRNLDKIRCTPLALSNHDNASGQERHLSGEISNVLTQTMPHLRDGNKECTAVSDLKAILIDSTQRRQNANLYFVDGVCWSLEQVLTSDQAIEAIGSEDFDYVFISIRRCNEFAPSIALRIRSIKSTVAPKIIAFDNYVPKYLGENLIRSGVDKVVISNRL